MTKPELTEIPETDLAGVAGGVRYAIDHRGGALQCTEPEAASTRSIAQPDL